MDLNVGHMPKEIRQKLKKPKQDRQKHWEKVPSPPQHQPDVNELTELEVEPCPQGSSGFT